MKKFLLTLAVAVGFVSTMSATEAVFEFTKPSSLTATDSNGQPMSFSDSGEANDAIILVGATLKSGEVSILTESNQTSAQNQPKLFYGSGSAAGWSYRFYNGSTITISVPSGYEITQVVFNSTNLGSNITTSDTGTFTFANSVGTWKVKSGESTNVMKISKTATGNNPVVSKITVTYSSLAAGTVASPTISCENNTVTISGPEGANIYYTTNGQEATTSSTKYTAPFAINATTTVNAIAEVNGVTSSVTETKCFYVPTQPMTVAQALTLIEDGYSNTALVKGYIVDIEEVSTQYGNATYTIADNADANIEAGLLVYRGYWLEGEKFTAEDQIEVGGTVVVEGTLVNFKDITPEIGTGNKINSYTAPVYDVAKPEFNFDEATNQLKITCATSGASIYYTLDGTDPTEESKAYTAPITIESTCTVKAIAYYKGEASPVASYTVTIVQNVTKIGEITGVGDVLTVTATVTAQASNGVILTDETGSIFYYNTSIDLTEYPIGSVVNVNGEVSEYNNGYQLTNSATLDVTSKGNGTYTSYPTATVYTAEMLTSAISKTGNYLASYVTIEGQLKVNGNYYNIIVEGTEVQGSVYYPTEAIKSQLTDGNSYKITGYNTSAKSPYFYVIATSVELTKDASSGGNGGNEGNEGDGDEEPGTLTGTKATYNFAEYLTLDGELNGVEWNPSAEDIEKGAIVVSDVVFYSGPVAMVGVAHEGATATNSPRLYNSNGNWTYRFYNGNNVTITVEEGCYISGIEFKATNLDDASITFTGEGTFSNNVWTATEPNKVTKVVISKTAKDNNPTISEMTVYYTGEYNGGNGDGGNGEGGDGEGDGGNEGPGSSAVSSLDSDNAPVEYYTISGVKVNNPVKGGLYIIRQGNKSSKAILK